MTLAADPGSLQGAVAAGILGCGPVILGTAEACAQLLEEAQEKGGAGGDPARWPGRRARGAAPRAAAPGVRASRSPAARPPRGADPRARGRAGSERPPRLCWRARFATRPPRPGAGPHMNVSMPIAAVLLDLGFPSATVKAVPMSPDRGLLADLAKERGADRLPDGRARGGGDRPTGAGRRTDPADPRSGRGDPSVGRAARPWTTRATGPSSPTAARSAFLRENLAARPLLRRRGGRPSGDPRLPLTEKREIRTREAEKRIGAHLCVGGGDRPDVLHQRNHRSGGYIPLTAGDLENWVTGSAGATRRPASRRRSGGSPPTARDRSPPGRRWPRSIASACRHPGRDGKHGAAGPADRLLRPEAAVFSPRTRPASWSGRRADFDLAGSSDPARARGG